MANKNLVKLGGAYVEITADNGKLISALKDSESRIQSFSSVFAKTGAAFSAIGVGITAPMKKAVEEFADFERQMLITQNVTKASGYQFEKLTRQAKELGATTSWTTSEVAKGMLSLGRMGFSSSEIEKTIKSVMDLGRALDVDVSTASKELGAVMRQFGADSSKAGHYADALATATNSAAIEMSELLESMKYVGAAGSAIGADVETVLALTMALRNSGVSASQAGTQLRSMFLKFQNPKDVALFADKFGVSIYNAEGRLKSFLDIIVEAQERARTMGDSLAVTARHMFGTLQAPAFITLLKSKDLEKYRDALYDCDGAAEDFRKAMESGVFGSLKLAESAVEAVGLQLGETLAPSVQETREFIQDLSEIIRTFIQQNAPLVNGIAKTGVAFTALGGVVLAGTGIIKGSVGVTNLLFGAFARLHEAWRKAGADAGVVKNEVQTLNAELEALAMTAATVDLSEPFVSVRNAALEAAASIDDLNAAYGRTTTVNPPTSKRPFHKINVDDLDVSNVPLSVGGKRGETYEMGTGQTEDTVSSSGADIVADQQAKAAEAYNSAVENAAHTKEVNTAVANANAEFAKDDVEDARKKAEGDLIQRESDLMYHSYFADQRTERNAEKQKNEEINEAVENLAQVQAEETQRQLEINESGAREEVKKNADAARKKANERAESRSAAWNSAFDSASAGLDREEAEEEAAWKAEDKAEKEARKKADRDKRAKRSATKNRRRTNLAKKQKKRRDDAAKKQAPPPAPETTNPAPEPEPELEFEKYTEKQKNADIKQARDDFAKETAAAAANLKKRNQENQKESSAWVDKYNVKNHAGRGQRLQTAVAKYRQDTASQRAELQRYLDEEGIEGASEGLAKAESSFNKDLDDWLKDNYDDNEAKYIKKVMSALEEGRDQSYIDNIPTEAYNESIQSQAHMLNGREDKQGMASSLESFKVIPPDEAKNLQSRAKTLLQEKDERLKWIKGAAEKEAAAVSEFNAKTAAAASELDAVIKEELGDGTAALVDDYESKLAAFEKADKDLTNADKKLKDTPKYVKDQEAEKKNKASDLASKADELTDKALKEKEKLDELQNNLKKKNEQAAGEIIARQETLKTDARVLKRQHKEGAIGDDQYQKKLGELQAENKELNKELGRIQKGTSERPELVEARKLVAAQQEKVANTATEAVDKSEKAETTANKKSSEYARLERERNAKATKREDAIVKMGAAKDRLDYARSPEGQSEIMARQREELLKTADKFASEAHPDGIESYAESERVIADAEARLDAKIAESEAKREKYVQEKNKKKGKGKKSKKAPAQKTPEQKALEEQRELARKEQEDLKEQERRENASLAETEKNEAIEQREEDKEEKKQRDASDNEKKKSRDKKRQARKGRRNDLKKRRTQKQNEIAQNTKEALEAIDAQEKASLDAIDSQLEASRKVVADATEETKKTVADAEKKADAAVAAGKKETAANLKKGKAEINKERKALDSTTKQALKNAEANRKADIKLAENLEKVQKSIATDTLASRTEELKLLGASASVASDFKATGYTFSGGNGNISIGGNVSSGPSIRELDVSQMIPARDYIKGEVAPTQTMTPGQAATAADLKRQQSRYATEGGGPWNIFKQLRQESRERAAESPSGRDPRRATSLSQQKAMIAAMREMKSASAEAGVALNTFNNIVNNGTVAGADFGKTMFTYVDPMREVSVTTTEAASATHTFNAAAAQTAEAVSVSSSAVDAASKSALEFTSSTREATVGEQQLTVEMNNAGTMAQAAGDNVAGVGRKSKVAAVGMQALRMAANATVGALKALGGMAVSMLAWTAVMTIFEKIAEYAHKTAEEMAKAREANAEMQGRDQENADNALSGFSTDEEKIDALVESAGSNKVLNNVEQQQLDSLYNDLNSRGIVNGLVVRDSTSNSGYRVLHAGAAAGMKANAARSEYFKLQDKKTGEAYDVSQFAPWAFELGTEVDAEDAKSVIKTTWASKAAKALEHMTPEQRKEFFGTPHAAGGRWNPFYYGTGLGERTAARWEQGEINGWEGEKNQQRKINAIIKEVDDKLAAAGAKGFVNAEDRDALRTYWLGMQGIDANTNWWLEDFQGKQLPGKDIVAAIDAFTADQGAGFIEAVKTIENAGATDKALGDLQAAYNANVADFKAQMNTPYMSEKDKQQAEADAQNAAFDRRGAFETINQTLGANQQKIDEENFTATEKQIAELDRQWQEFMEKAGVSITEEGEAVGDLLDDEWTAFNTAWDSYQAQRAAMDKTAEQERKEKREKEENARSQETTEKLSGLFANYIQAVRSGNANNIQQAAAILNQERAAAKTNGVDLSQYYKDTVGEIKELLNETKTTLSTHSTFSAFEFLDMAQDVVIDVQRQQLEQMRNLNFNAREIYRWMTTQDEYKDYL